MNLNADTMLSSEMNLSNDWELVQRVIYASAMPGARADETQLEGSR